MFKFLFRKKEVEVVKETQRETVERAVQELNEILGGMAVKAKVSVDLESGLLGVDLPEQMPDEALALPAPEKDEAASTETSEKTSETEAEPKEETAPKEDKPVAA